MVHHSNCPLCKADGTDPFLTSVDHLVSGEKFKIYRCRNCSFTFTNDYPGEDESGSYYESEDYISHTDSGKTLFEKVYRIVRSMMLRRKRNIVCKTVGLTAGNILDIGCGTGHFLNEMKQSGWQASGIEINQKARAFAITNFSLDVIPPSGISALAEKTRDCISLWHVLEHLNNPDEWFGEIKRLLKPGGKIVVALPNCHSFDAAHYGAEWAAWDVPRHLWHFSPATFELFAQKAGLTITGMKVLPFDVFYISILSEKHRGSNIPALKGMIKGSIFSILSFFTPERSSSLVFILEAQ